MEIGWTWYGASWQRSHVNTACKLLLFGHAFETLGCRVVGLRTDNFNFASQRAIEALGARRDVDGAPCGSSFGMTVLWMPEWPLSGTQMPQL